MHPPAIAIDAEANESAFSGLAEFIIRRGDLDLLALGRSFDLLRHLAIEVGGRGTATRTVLVIHACGSSSWNRRRRTARRRPRPSGDQYVMAAALAAPAV